MKIIITQSKVVLSVVLCCLAGMLSSCATKAPPPPAYGVVANQLPAIQPGYARLFLFCMKNSNVYSFYVDDKKVGKVWGLNFLFVDHPAGSCEVAADYFQVFKKTRVKLNLVAGETRYVLVEYDPTIHLQDLFLKPLPRLIILEPEQAVPALKQCYYVGPSLPSFSPSK